MPETPSVRHITHNEWAWVAAATVIILALAAALNVMGYLTAPPAHHFAGMVYAWEDGQTYLAKIRQGRWKNLHIGSPPFPMLKASSSKSG